MFEIDLSTIDPNRCRSNAEDCTAAENWLDTTAFFTSSSSAHKECCKLWITISYLLAVNHPLYRRCAHQEIVRDCNLVAHEVQKQFDALVRETIGCQNLLGRTPNLNAFIVDGLDEFCGLDEWKQIMELILNLVHQDPDAPLAWIITSRSEQCLVAFFDQNGIVWKRARKQPIRIDSSDAQTDTFYAFQEVNSRIFSNGTLYRDLQRGQLSPWQDGMVIAAYDIWPQWFDKGDR